MTQQKQNSTNLLLSQLAEISRQLRALQSSASGITGEIECAKKEADNIQKDIEPSQRVLIEPINDAGDKVFHVHWKKGVAVLFYDHDRKYWFIKEKNSTDHDGMAGGDTMDDCIEQFLKAE